MLNSAAEDTDPDHIKKRDLSAFKGCTVLGKKELYDEFLKDKPVPKWLAEMVTDNRSNANELLLAADCKNPEQLHKTNKGV